MPDIQLERGLTFFFEHQVEFEHREIPVEKQVAIGWEAGYETGRHEITTKIKRTFKLDCKG